MDPSRSADGLFSGMFARGEAAAQASEQALLEAMVEVELSLVRALVKARIAPERAARDLDDLGQVAIDIAELGRSSADKGTPVPMLVSALRGLLGDTPASEWVHAGATSQDVLDTAIMLVAKRSLGPLLADLGAAADRCAALASEHRGSLQAGRTLLQHAVPLTFGLKAAGWLQAIDDASGGLEQVRSSELGLQFGGAAGTLAALGDSGLEVMAILASELELREPTLPWHTNRVAPARLASALGIALGVTGKVARDVALLAQTEVGELSEGRGDGRGGSSTMPHKRNPVAAVAALACAQRGPGLVATILASIVQEHERAAGAWQAEWQPLLELLRLAGSAAAALRELLGELELDPGRMRLNTGLTHGLLMSESAAAVLSQTLGRAAAAEIVQEAAARVEHEGRELRDVLLERPEVAGALDREALDRALSPEEYLGATDKLIDRALSAHRER